MKTKTNKLLNLSFKLIPTLILSLAILSFAGGRVSAQTVSLSVPMQVRTATSAELADLNADFTSSTSPINDGYNLPNDTGKVGLGLVYILEASHDLPTCAQGIQAAVTGNQAYSYTGTDTSPWNNPSDFPEVVGALYKGSTAPANALGALTWVADAALNTDYPIQTSQSYPITVQELSDGLVGAVKFEVIDNVSQLGAQFSWEFHGTAQLAITYDDSTCPQNQPPVVSSSTSSTGSNTPAGTVLVPGSSLAASDPDGDTLTYSITAGNGGGYFAIDSTSGNITTTQTGIPAGTNTLTIQVDDGNGGTATSTVTITITNSTTPALYCPSPYDTNQLLSPTGDCDGDGISNQAEGFDPDGDGNPSTGTTPLDTDKDGIPDYLDLDSDNDGILDSEEKGTGTTPADTDSDGTPDFQDLDSDNDGATDLTESGRSYTDANSDGVVDGSINTYGLAASAVSSANAQTYSLSSFKDSDGNGTPDFRQATSKNSLTSLASTGTNLSLILALALTTSIAALSLRKFSKR